MRMNLGRTAGMIAAAAVASSLIGGCSAHVSDEGDNAKRVVVNSPLGALKVRTDEVDPQDTGLVVYPGAVLKPKEKDKDHDNGNEANVNIQTPWFGVKVVALTYTSADPTDKIWDYYKKELGKYGHVLECKPGSPDMGKKVADDDDKTLTCDKAQNKGMNIQIDSTELKAGTRDRQHIVGIKPSANGTEFTLVYVNTRKGKESI